MSTKEKLISNTTFMFLNWIFATALTLAFWLVLGNTLDITSYGIVATTIQLNALIVPIVLLGMDTTINKLIPEFLQKGDKDSVQGIINTSTRFIFFVSVAVAIILVLGAGPISSVLKIGQVMIWITGLSVVIMAQSYLFGYIYYGFQDMKKFFLTTLIGEIVLVVAALAFAALGWGYVGAFVADVLAFLAMLVSRLSTKLSNISKSPHIERKTILRYSLPALWVVILSVILSNTQLLILSSLKTLEAAGSFAVAMKVITVIPTVPLLFSNALFPITAGLSAFKTAKRRQSYLISLIFRYSILLVAPLAVYMVFFGKELILFFKPGDSLGALSFLPELAVGAAFTGLANLILSSLYALGHPEKYKDSYLVATIIYAVSAIVLTYYFSSLGLAVSYMVSSIVLFLAGFFFVSRYTTLKLPMRSFAMIAASLALSLVVLHFLSGLVIGIKSAILCSSAAGIVYFMLLGLMGFYKSEDLGIYDSVVAKIPYKETRPIGWLIGSVRSVIATFAKGRFMEGHS